jgi:hypothetical protein
LDPQRLFDGAHIRITRQGCGPLWATFDNFDAARRGFDPVRLPLTATTAGYAPCHVQTSGNDWYLGPDLDAALALTPGTGRALGISMGAFGALLFAAALGTTEVIMVSPRFPAPLGWPRTAKIYAANPPPGWQARAEQATRALPRGVILFDPHHPDDKAATRWLMARNPRLRAVAVPFASHPATSLFRESQSWGTLQDLMLTCPFEALPTAIARLRRQMRLKSERYRVSIAPVIPS